jgi:hypothetical protein
LEIQSQQGIKVIGGNQIRTFVTLHEDQALSMYVNAKDFKISAEVAFTGFLQILEDGNMARKGEFLLYPEWAPGSCAGKKKDFVGIFQQENRKSIQDFIEINRLNTSRGPELRCIFNYYNAR